MTTLNKPKFKGTHRGTNTVASLDPLLGSVGLLLSSSATISHVRFLALKLARGFFACTHCNPCSTLLVVLDRPPSWLAPDCGVARGSRPVLLSTDKVSWTGACGCCCGSTRVCGRRSSDRNSGGYVGFDSLPGIPPRAAWVLPGTYWSSSHPALGLGSDLQSVPPGGLGAKVT